MKNFNFLLKNQLFPYLLCLALAPLPLTLLYKFSDVPSQHLHYFFLTLLVALKVILFKDKEYKTYLNTNLKTLFVKQYGRQPSNKEFVSLKELFITYRAWAVYISAFFVIVIYLFREIIRQ